MSHKVGNANVGSYVSVRNTGGRALRILGMKVSLSRDGKALAVLPAQNYFETPTSKDSVLFVPFSLKPGEQWAHATNFLQFFDRSTEKLYRESESALQGDIRQKIAARPEDNKQAVVAEAALIKPFLDLFERFFLWLPGEYSMELAVDAEPGSASFVKRYRFTLFESDSDELRSHIEDYKFGGGISYNVGRHVGLAVPLVRHDG
ncbi:hypothetical protein AZ34_09095 [Hylemonella gracilis str. Niagara R]|uniref:Uncharacterized protein n=1 Tax=Hylemonella gracilis str. Niagara R TaxID=1458275 RepID=A0A016XH44_9BURK|nr:hypothetical protein [Hylemonella gracilis]EYC51225.1 hypothetical protein AZ34_09095 [Hylemonella gracilis str. Niagara R]